MSFPLHPWKKKSADAHEKYFGSQNRTARTFVLRLKKKHSAKVFYPTAKKLKSTNLNCCVLYSQNRTSFKFLFPYVLDLYDKMLKLFKNNITNNLTWLLNITWSARVAFSDIQVPLVNILLAKYGQQTNTGCFTHRDPFEIKNLRSKLLFYFF